MVAHALWFGVSKLTINCVEMVALVWGLELLFEQGATGKVLVLGDSQLKMSKTQPRAQEIAFIPAAGFMHQDGFGSTLVLHWFYIGSTLVLPTLEVTPSWQNGHQPPAGGLGCA